MSLNERTTTEAAWLEDYAQNRVDLPGADEPWLAERRAESVHRFERLGLPHRRIESWKYTDLRARLDVLEPATPWRGPVDQTSLLADPFAEIACDRLVFINGFFRADLSVLPKGIEVSTLGTARPAWSKAALGAGPSTDHAVAAINLALARDGALIHVPRAFIGERPLHLMFLDTSDQGAARAMHLRNAIVIDEGARLTLLETHRGKGGAGDLTNIVTEITVATRAQLDHIKIVADAETSQHVSAIFAQLDEDAAYRPFVLNTSAALARTELFVKLAGRQANFALAAATLAGGREHIDITTLVDHAAPNATSRQVVKSVIDGHGRGIYQGKIIVREGANGTDSHQLAKSILLSPTAEADTKPELEIYADDVKCGHGATAGALDENALFYLRSRGIPENAAKSLLLEAFIEDAIAAIALPDIRDAVSRAARDKLERLRGPA